MGKLIKFNNLGVELEGKLINSSGGVNYIRTPFRGEVYAVSNDDLVSSEGCDEMKLTDGVSYIMTTDIEVFDEVQDINGLTQLDWVICIEENTDDSLMLYVKIPKQKLLVSWKDPTSEDVFETYIETDALWEEEGITIENSLNLKDIKPKKLTTTLGCCNVIF